MTRVDKVALVALGLRVGFPLAEALAGVHLAGDTLVRIFFIITLLLFLILSFPKHFRTFLWRVRHRLLLTWIFVGVVPIILICVLLAETGNILMGRSSVT